MSLFRLQGCLFQNSAPEKMLCLQPKSRGSKRRICKLFRGYSGAVRSTFSSQLFLLTQTWIRSSLQLLRLRIPADELKMDQLSTFTYAAPPSRPYVPSHIG